jgi:hypothetical protein
MSFLAKVWSYKKKQSLPDSSFAYVDAEGGHFPYKDENGKIDLAHLRNAFSRLPQSKFSPEIKKRIHSKLVRVANQVGFKHKPCSIPGCKGSSPAKKSMLEDSAEFYSFQAEAFRNLRISMGVSWVM